MSKKRGRSQAKPRVRRQYNTKNVLLVVALVLGIILGASYLSNGITGLAVFETADGPSVYGLSGSVNSSGVAVMNVTINGSTDLSVNLSGFHTLEFSDGLTLITNFSHNFSTSPINLSLISITVTSNSIVINHSEQLLVNETKSISIDDSETKSICVKDERIPSAGFITADCTGTNETLFTRAQCMSGTTTNSVTCDYSSGRFIVSDLVHSGIRTQGGALGFENDTYEFNATRGFNVFPLVMHNLLETGTNLTANVTFQSESFPGNVVGAGTIEQILFLNNTEYFNISLGATLAQINSPNVTVNVTLYNVTRVANVTVADQIIDVAQVTIIMPAISTYDFYANVSAFGVTMSDITNTTQICVDSTKTFTIFNNGTEPISDITTTVTGPFEVMLKPSLDRAVIQPGENITIVVQAELNESTATDTAVINITGVGLSQSIDVDFTQPGAGWAAYPVQNNKYLVASANSFICINNPTYSVDLNFDQSFDTSEIASADYVGTFDDRCNSLQIHDTFFELNSNSFLSLLDQAPLGTIISPVSTGFVAQQNTLDVTSSGYQGGGHFCANGYNTLRVQLGNFSNSYCPLCDSDNRTETDFTDGVDNDCDGQTDCFDLDACGVPACAGLNDNICPEPEIGFCNDGLDNDGNGLTDCEDIGACCGASTCSSAVACRLFQGAGFIDTCRTIDEPGVYTLSSDLTTSGNCGGAGCPDAHQTSNTGQQCLVLAEDDITLDCAGHTITFDADGGNFDLEAGIFVGYKNGGFISGVDNVTIRNCNIVDATSDAISSGVFVGSGTNSLTFHSSSIYVVGDNVRAFQSNGQRTEVYNSTFIGNFTTSRSRVVGFYSSRAEFYNNTVYQHGTPCTAASCEAAIAMLNQHHHVNNNTIFAYKGSGVGASSSTGGTVINNQIVGGNGYGVGALGGGVVVANNTIEWNSSTAGHTGIRFTADDARIYNNIITHNSTVASYAMDTQSSGNLDNLTIYDNTIIVNGGTGGGIFVDQRTLQAAPVAFYNNTIQVNGSNVRSGIEFDSSSGISSAHYQVYNNTIVVDGNPTTAGILLNSSNNVNTTQNNIMAAGSTGVSIYGATSGITVSKNVINHTQANTRSVYLESTTAGTIADNTIENAAQTFALNSSQNIIIGINTLINTSEYLTIVSSSAIRVLDSQMSSYDIITSDIAFEDENVSKVDFTNLTVSGANFFDDVNVSGEFIAINGSQVGFNRSADLTFYNLSYTNPEAFVDQTDNGTFVECDPIKCGGEVFTNGTFVYNVTDFTTFTVQDTGFIVNATLLGSTQDRYVPQNGFFTIEAEVGCAGVSVCNGIIATLDPIITDPAVGYPLVTDDIVYVTEDSGDGGPVGINSSEESFYIGSGASDSFVDVDIESDGNLITVGDDGNINAVNVINGSVTRLVSGSFPLANIAIAADGNFYITVNSFGTRELVWYNRTSLDSSTVASQYTDFDDELNAIDIDANGNVVLGGGDDPFVGYYNVTNDTVVIINETAFSDEIWAIKVDSNGNYIVGDIDGYLYMVNSSTGITSEITDQFEEIQGISIDNNGDYIVADIGGLAAPSIGDIIVADGPGEGIYRVYAENGSIYAIDTDGPSGGFDDGPFGVEVVLHQADVGGGPSQILETYYTPNPVGVGNVVQCGVLVNVSMDSVEFEITYPDMSSVVYNGTNVSNNWTSSTFTANLHGEYACDVTATKTAGGTDTSSVSFDAGAAGVIPVGAGFPFYTTSLNPVYPNQSSCLNSLNPGETCNQTWIVNATGNAGSTWEFFVIYNGSTLVTQTMNITISDTSLFIFDDTDVEGGSQTKFANQNVNFYANYTDLNTSDAIVGLCNFTLSPYVNNTAMTFNMSGDEVYHYNTSVPINGTFDWTANCTNELSFANLSATDDVLISVQGQTGEVPEFSTVVLMLALGLILGGFVVIRRRE